MDWKKTPWTKRRWTKTRRITKDTQSEQENLKIDPTLYRPLEDNFVRMSYNKYIYILKFDFTHENTYFFLLYFENWSYFWIFEFIRTDWLDGPIPSPIPKTFQLTHLCPPLRSTFAVRETANVSRRMSLAPIMPRDVSLSDSKCWTQRWA